MSSTTATNPRDLSLPRRLAARPHWLWIGLLALLFLLLFRTFLLRSFYIIADSNHLGGALRNLAGGHFNSDWSHGLLLPLIGLYYIHTHRRRLLALPRRLSWPGLVLLLAGVVSYAFWLGPGRNDMLSGYSMILALFGMVLFLMGPARMRLLWFPICFLALGVKISERPWNRLADLLQNLASQAATLCLKILGVEAELAGNVIQITHHGVTNAMGVAQACAGLRMLMAFVALAGAMAFLFDRHSWQRAVMFTMGLPVALVVNIGRITVLGVITQYNPQLAQGGFHTFVGMTMLIPAVLLLLLIGWLLDRLIIYDKPPGPAAEPAAAPRVSATAWRGVDWGRFGRGASLGSGGVLAGLSLGAAAFWMIGPLQAALGTKGLGLAVLAALAAVTLAAAWAQRRLQPDRAVTAPRHWAAVGAVVAVLGVSAAGLSAVIWAGNWVMIKKPVPMPGQFYQLPRELGSWKHVGDPPPLSAEMIEELKTSVFLSRYYEDQSLPPHSPGRRVLLHTPYYTGTVDTVPHVPERCYVGGGADPRGVGQVTLRLEGPQYRMEGNRPVVDLPPRPDLPDRPARVKLPAAVFPATRFVFDHRDAGTGQLRTSTVVYFFIANGQFLPTPDDVRVKGFDPRDRYSYYCKVEVLVEGVSDTPRDAGGQELAVARVNRFLSDALPEIMALLPDWDQVLAGQWPRP